MPYRPQRRRGRFATYVRERMTNKDRVHVTPLKAGFTVTTLPGLNANDTDASKVIGVVDVENMVIIPKPLDNFTVKGRVRRDDEQET